MLRILVLARHIEVDESLEVYHQIMTGGFLGDDHELDEFLEETLMTEVVKDRGTALRFHRKLGDVTDAEEVSRHPSRQKMN